MGKRSERRKLQQTTKSFFAWAANSASKKNLDPLKNLDASYVWPAGIQNAADERTRFFKVLTLKPLGRKRKTKAKGVNK
jgi:hypothetical protein